MKKIKQLSVISIMQIVFWVAFLFLAVYAFSQTTSLSNSILRVLIILPLQLLLFYCCFLYLIPVYFENKKYWQFYGLLTLLLSFTTSVRLILRSFFYDFVGGGTIQLNFSLQLVIIIISQLVIVLIACLLAVAKQKYTYERKYLEAKNQFLQSELNYLKAQVSPHFLLNTLNNIYSFAVTNSPQTPDAVLKLSELLKYFLYESSKKKITVQREFEIIQSYISLFQLRFQHSLNISSNFSVLHKSSEIEPLILMNLVENAFKHSGIGIEEGSFITIDAEEKNGSLQFVIENSKMHVNETITQNGGIGLENIAKRLAIEYPDKQLLTIKENETTFFVKLMIPFI